MKDFPLSIIAGRTAYKKIAQAGWDPALFTAMAGASGGAKLLALTHLDRFLFADYLQRSNHPMELYGSSIGSWRHAALAAPDPLAAVTQLQERYVGQQWREDDPRKPSEVVDELCEWVIDGFCDESLRTHLCAHPRFTTHIVTALGLGMNSKPNGPLLGMGMGISAVGNLVSRQLLARGFRRVVFSSGASNAFEFKDFDTLHVTLDSNIVRPALLASGSIPFLMSGQSNIPGAPEGQYWDGGIIDYHFDFANHQGEGLMLYPHFSEQTVIGWFDKSLPWRVNKAHHLDRALILAPSPAYVARLPYGKIPDRKDFNRLSQTDRISYWRKAMAMSEELAESFSLAIEDSDPTRYIQQLA